MVANKILSKNGGDLYCLIGGGTDFTPGGWPVPPKPKPRFVMTLGNIRGWAISAVLDPFGVSQLLGEPDREALRKVTRSIEEGRVAIGEYEPLAREAMGRLIGSA